MKDAQAPTILGESSVFGPGFTEAWEQFVHNELLIRENSVSKRRWYNLMLSGINGSHLNMATPTRSSTDPSRYETDELHECMRKL